MKRSPISIANLSAFLSLSVPSPEEARAQLAAIRSTGLTRAQRAAILCAPYGVVQSWEDGRRKPTMLARRRIAEVYSAVLEGKLVDGL
jgi:DNA-binding transcriptional regulator YiaG